MYVSHGQFYVFISCIAFGSISSLFFVFARPLCLAIKNRLLNSIIEFLLFVLVAVLFNLYAFALQMGNFRLYMPFGVLFGMLLGYKTFAFALAKAYVLVYNIFKQKKRKKGYGVKKSKHI